MTALRRKAKGLVDRTFQASLVIDTRATTAVVEAQKADGSWLQATGSARLAPGDTFNARVGADLALARALRKLANKLEREHRRKGLLDSGINVGTVNVEIGKIEAFSSARNLIERLSGQANVAVAEPEFEDGTVFTDGYMHWFRESGSWYYFGLDDAYRATRKEHSGLQDESIPRLVDRGKLQLVSVLPNGTRIEFANDRRPDEVWYKVDGEWYYKNTDTGAGYKSGDFDDGDVSAFAALRNGSRVLVEIPRNEAQDYKVADAALTVEFEDGAIVVDRNLNPWLRRDGYWFHFENDVAMKSYLEDDDVERLVKRNKLYVVPEVLPVGTRLACPESFDSNLTWVKRSDGWKFVSTADGADYDSHDFREGDTAVHSHLLAGTRVLAELPDSFVEPLVDPYDPINQLAENLRGPQAPTPAWGKQLLDTQVSEPVETAPLPNGTVVSYSDRLPGAAYWVKQSDRWHIVDLDGGLVDSVQSDESIQRQLDNGYFARVTELPNGTEVRWANSKLDYIEWYKVDGEWRYRSTRDGYANVSVDFRDGDAAVFAKLADGRRVITKLPRGEA